MLLFLDPHERPGDGQPVDPLLAFQRLGHWNGSVQSLSHIQPFEAPWTAARQASVSITNSRNVLKLISIELVMPSNNLILHCPLLLPSTFPSIRIFSSESVLHIRWPKYWSFSFSISPCNEYSELISFRMNSLTLLVIQVTPKSLLQHHSLKASVLRSLSPWPPLSTFCL